MTQSERIDDIDIMLEEFDIEECICKWKQSSNGDWFIEKTNANCPIKFERHFKRC
jgi:hypothetical protein